MIKAILLNGRAGLLDTETNDVCALPDNHKLLETIGGGVIGAVNLDTDQEVKLNWRRIYEDEIGRILPDLLN